MAPPTVATVVVSIWAAYAVFQIFTLKDNDEELLIPFEKKPRRWSPRLLIPKIAALVLLFYSIAFKAGDLVNQHLLASALAATGIWVMLYLPPSSGIHKRGLYLKTDHWTLWRKVRKYRWLSSGVLQVNPGFFSISSRKLEIPEEFADDVRVMLNSQCPDCEISAS